MIKSTTRDHEALANAIHRGVRFVTNGSLWGMYDERRNLYFVFSYAQVIAVVDYLGDNSIVSTHKWSATTTRHQCVAHRAVAEYLQDRGFIVTDKRINTYGQIVGTD